MRPTNEQLQQFARDMVATMRRVLGLTAAQTERPGWYRDQALSEAKRAELRTATRPLIMAFARRFPRQRGTQ